MMKYRIFYFLPIFLLMSFVCFESKVFHSDKDGEILIVGNKENKLFNEAIDLEKLADPKILKVDYIEDLKKIITKHVIAKDSVKKDAEVCIKLYFDPETLKVKEVYFLFRRISADKVFTVSEMEAIENDLKESIIATKNVSWINLREIDRQLKETKFVDHIIGFKVYQLFSYKNGDFDYDKIWIL